MMTGSHSALALGRMACMAKGRLDTGQSQSLRGAGAPFLPESPIQALGPGKGSLCVQGHCLEVTRERAAARVAEASSKEFCD